MHPITTGAAALALLAAPLASAQTTTAPAGSATSGLGGLGGLLGNALPGVGKVGAGNAAGLIGYCVKNNYLNADSATSVLGRLTGQQGVTTSSGYAAGQAGTVQAGDQAFSLANLKGQLRTRMCDAVLKRGAALLGR